jgi:hypothetical protein
MLDQQSEIYDRYPLGVAFDSGFASKNNLMASKTKNIKDVCFAKKRSVHEYGMCNRKWVFKGLRCFSVGIEFGIS